jgi:serine/threonine-protein kinase HipA
LSTLIDEQSGEASLDLALSVAEYFRLTQDEAKRAAHEVATAVTQWKKEAIRLGVPTQELETVATAFEHSELEKGRRFS